MSFKGSVSLFQCLTQWDLKLVSNACIFIYMNFKQDLRLLPPSPPALCVTFAPTVSSRSICDVRSRPLLPLYVSPPALYVTFAPAFSSRSMCDARSRHLLLLYV